MNQDAMKEFRKVNNLKQKDLAEYLDTDRSFISKVEKGDSGLSRKNLKKILSNPNGWDVSMFAKLENLGDIGNIQIGKNTYTNNSNTIDKSVEESSTLPQTAWDVIQMQARQIDRLIAILEAQVRDGNK